MIVLSNPDPILSSVNTKYVDKIKPLQYFRKKNICISNLNLTVPLHILTFMFVKRQ